MNRPQCPGVQTLKGLLAGTLAAEDADNVTRHLNTCQHCCDALADVSDSHSGLVNQLRKVGAENRRSHRRDEDVAFEIGDPGTQLHAVKRNDSSSLDDSPSTAASGTLGNYQIIRQIGRGGMGVVYEARQVTLGRLVALKVLPSEVFQRPEAVQRFQREAETAASLHHTNIVPVFEVGHANDTWFYAMQLIDGYGLDVVQKEVQTLRSRIAELTEAVANAPTARKEAVPPAVATTGEFVSVASTNIAGRNRAKSDDARRNRIRESERRFDVARMLSILGRSALSNSEASSPADVEQPRSGSAGTESANDRQANNQLSVTLAESHYRSVAEIGRQAASALQHAHQRGIVHRDVKPSNLILDNDGIVWLADFGLAKRDEVDLTRTNEMPGTVRFMSPERFNGHVDATSDVYALGVTLYELLTLKKAFSAISYPALMQQIQDDVPPEPRQIDRSIPFDLQTIILKAMAKDPAHRFASAQVMQDDLTRFLNGQPITARRVGTLERLWLWSKKRRALAASFLTIALLVLATAVGSTVAAFHFNEQKVAKTKLATANLQLATQKTVESEKAIEQRDAAYQNAYFADIRQAHQDWKNGQLRRMLTTLERYVPAFPAQDVRGWEWYYLLSRAHQDAKTLLDHDGKVTQVTWSPNGDRLISVGTDQTLRIWNRKGELQKKIRIAGIRRFAFNADGSRFATVSGDPVVRIWDSVGGNQIKAIRTTLSALGHIDWSNHNDQIAVTLLSDTKPGLALLNAESGEVQPQKTLNLQNPISHVQFSPDGKRLGLLFSRTHFEVFDIQSRSYRYSRMFADLQAFNELQAMSFDWHPNSTRFAVGTFQNGARVYDVAEGLALPTTVAILQDDTSSDTVAFSPDGKRLVVGNRAQRIDVFDIESKTQVASLKGHLSSVRSTSHHPTDLIVASGANDGAIKMWNIPAHDAKTPTYNYGADDIKAGKCSSGRWSWQQAKNSVVINDATTGQQLAKVDGVLRVTAVRYFPESKHALFAHRQGSSYTYGYDHIWIINTDTWKLREHIQPVAAGFPSSVMEGNFAAAARSGIVSVFNGQTGKTHVIQPHTGLGTLGLSPDGKTLATCSYGEVALWKTESGKEMARLYGHQPRGFMPTLHWGNRGRYFATGSIDQTVKIWDAQSKRLLQTLRGLQGTPLYHYFGFSPDDYRFMAAGPQNLKVWDVQSGRELLSFELSELGDTASTLAFFDEFRTNKTATGYRLSERILRFDALEKATALSENQRGVEQFRHSSLHALSRELLFNSTDEKSRERGLKLARQALELDPANAQYMFTIGLAEFDRKDYPAAVQILKMASASGLQQQPELQYVLAFCLKQSGKAAEAQTTFQLAVKLFATSEDIDVDLMPLINEISAGFIAPDDAGQAPGTIKVNTLEDLVDGIDDGRISLREAIALVKDGGNIEFDVEGTIKLRSGLLRIDKSLTIKGPGKSKLTIDSGDRFRLLVVEDGDPNKVSQVQLSGLTFTRGYSTDRLTGGPSYVEWKEPRGCIFASGTLTINDCNITRNRLEKGVGGALYLKAGSKVALNRCSIDSNTSIGGGAIYIQPTAHLTVEGCTFSSNSALPGSSGAIRNHGTLLATNSTFSNNNAGNGGAISAFRSQSMTSINHCTFIANSSDAVSFIGDPTSNSLAKLEISNSLFANNKNRALDELLDITVVGSVQLTINHCLLNKLNGEFDGENNLVGVDASVGPLADNGGLTKTHALLTDSPAIDAARAAPAKSPLEFDQRGTPFRRIVDSDGKSGAAADIGAFELQRK